MSTQTPIIAATEKYHVHNVEEADSDCFLHLPDGLRAVGRTRRKAHCPELFLWDIYRRASCLGARKQKRDSRAIARLSRERCLATLPAKWAGRAAGSPRLWWSWPLQGGKGGLQLEHKHPRTRRERKCFCQEQDFGPRRGQSHRKEASRSLRRQASCQGCISSSVARTRWWRKRGSA